jgi:uroporphyrinogen decarboxylase
MATATISHSATATAMTSRERVLAVLGGDVPDRVPVWFGSTPEFWRKAMREMGTTDPEEVLNRFGDDFRRISVNASLSGYTLPAGADGISFFGVPKRGLGVGQPMWHPLANATLREVEAYHWPNPKGDLEVVAPRTAMTGRYATLGGVQSVFFHDLIDLVGMDALGLMMYDRPEVVDAILRHIVDYYVALNRRVFDRSRRFIDIFFIFNDFGCQYGPLVSPAMFGRFFVPHLKRLADLGHEYGLKVMLHSCGSISPLIPSLIDCSIDALHPVQPCRGMDLAKLKAEFGGRIVFNGAIDAQHTLLSGTPEAVRRKTREVLDILMPGGGYIGGASHDTILEDTPFANVQAMFETLHEFGIY